MMLSLVLLGALCCFVQGDQIKLQVDDVHVLYADGQKISSGNAWSQVYTVNRDSYNVLAFYAENYNGAKGVALTIDGDPPPVGSWRCITVNNINDAPSGWNTQGFNTNGWGKAQEINGPQQFFNGGPWIWAAQGGNKCICRIDFTVEVKLQVDDIHELYDGSGLLSSGQWWSHVYTAHASMYLALYAENISGPNGVVMSINGHILVASDMKCKAVSGSKSQIDAANPGWKDPNFDDSSWPNSVPASNPTPAQIPGANKSNVLWVSGNSYKIICRVEIF